MSGLFRPKACSFEKIHYTIPAVVVFNEKLSDAGVRLLLVLKAMDSKSHNWQPRQDDIAKRLGWGRDKMRKAMKDCVALGYLKVIQEKNVEIIEKNGKKLTKITFAHNNFEYDLEGGYPVETDNSNNFAVTGNPSTGNPSPGNPALLMNHERITHEYEDKREKAAADAPPAAEAAPVSRTPEKLSFGEFGKCKLTAQEHSALLEELGQHELDYWIQKYDLYFAANGKKPGAFKATIRNWKLKDPDQYRPPAERASAAHAVDLQKPVSPHLYPHRLFIERFPGRRIFPRIVEIHSGLEDCEKRGICQLPETLDPNAKIVDFNVYIPTEYQGYLTKLAEIKELSMRKK